MEQRRQKMKNRKLLNKGLAIVVFILFLTVSTISVAGISKVFQPLSMGLQEPVPYIEGVVGENSWYISEVIITFSYDPGRVQEIQYKLNGQWHEYTDSGINIDDDGVYNIPWFWVDEVGEPHNGWPITFNLDMSPPTIQLNKNIETDQITFTASCSDDVSDVELVEFYLDDELIKTSIGEPYEYTWTGVGKHIVHAVGYNFAGLSVESKKLDTTPRSRSHYLQLFDNLFQRIYQIIFWIQQINLK